MAINVQLLGAFLQAYDSTTNVYKFNFTLNNPLLATTSIEYLPTYAVPVAPTALVLPSATIWAFYLRNTAAAGNIVVQQQVTGGALNTSANSELILPGGIKMYFQPVETGGGLIAITLTASQANVTAEILMAA
jgi:hypothetical protein